MTAQVSTSLLNGGSMSLLFKADKLMSLAQTVTGAVAGKSSNATVSTLNTVLSQYDGLMLGFEMKKQSSAFHIITWKGRNRFVSVSPLSMCK